jgi:hypothetical protein
LGSPWVETVEHKSGAVTEGRENLHKQGLRNNNFHQMSLRWSTKGDSEKICWKGSDKRYKILSKCLESKDHLKYE